MARRQRSKILVEAKQTLADAIRTKNQDGELEKAAALVDELISSCALAKVSYLSQPAVRKQLQKAAEELSGLSMELWMEDPQKPNLSNLHSILSRLSAITFIPEGVA